MPMPSLNALGLTLLCPGFQLAESNRSAVAAPAVKRKSPPRTVATNRPLPRGNTVCDAGAVSMSIGGRMDAPLARMLPQRFEPLAKRFGPFGKQAMRNPRGALHEGG